MNQKLTLSLFGLVTATGLAALLVQTVELRKETRTLKASLVEILKRPPVPPPPTPPESTAPLIEVADVMTKLQRHANKLYFAGQHENWKLADFYVEEIEETAKAFSKMNVMHGQVNVSGLMGALILPEIEELERAVSEADGAAFHKHYQALISNCNACHTAARLPFIVVQDPKSPAYDNQRYEPLTAVAGSTAASPAATVQVEAPQPAKP
jgi:hypothetical protein